MKNFLDMFHDAIGDQLVNQASRLFGESSQNLSSALASVLPALTGSLVQKGGTEAGARGVQEYLNANGYDGSALSKVGELLSGNADELQRSGGNALKYLIGDKLSLLIDVISGSTNLKPSSAGGFLKIVAPLLLNVVGKHVKRHGLNADSIKHLLLDQRRTVLNSTPSSIGELLGFASLADLGESVESVSGIKTEGGAQSPESKPLMSRLLPWLVLLLAALALFYFLNRGCAEAKTRSADAKETMTSSPAEDGARSATVTAPASNTTPKAVTAPQATSAVLPPVQEGGTFIEKISNAISTKTVSVNTAYILDEGNFQGKSAILTRQSETELDQLAKILKVNPNVKIRIEAHTDNSGGNADINRQLSTQQALAVRTFLQDRGIVMNRIESIGRGQIKPLSPNDTEAGREQNKRIEIFLSQN